MSIQWEQLEPSATSDQVNIFTQDSNGDYITNTAMIKMKMSAFNYMSSTQVVKVQCTVTNSFGQIAYDVYEFYLNSPPTVGVSVVSLVSNTSVYTNTSWPYYVNGTAPFSKYEITMTNWSFNGMSQAFKLYMKVESVYYLVSDYFNTNTSSFRLPPLSVDDSVKNISLCVNALDSYDGEASNCIVYYNVGNDLSY